MGAVPTQSEIVQEKGFRSRLFGFDKNDVLDYVNALAAEAQDQELQYKEQVRTMQVQLERLQGEQSAARQCVEKLQQELQVAQQQNEDLTKKLAGSEKRSSDWQERSRSGQQKLLEAQLKIRDMQKEMEALQAQAEAAQQAAAQVPAHEPAMPPISEFYSAPQEAEPSTAAAEAISAQITERARIEARKILADAQLYAENAEQRLQQQAYEQKERMAEHARGIAAGVMLLRNRLSRVDDRLSSASQELEHATAAIYQALDQAEADLQALGGRLNNFNPEAPLPQEVGDEPPRQRVTARPRAAARQQQAPAAGAGRLRRCGNSGRSVSQDLKEAIRLMDQE